ncbi:hypothetical protein [Ferrimonas sp. YFM]|uniref:hypothetical protein n=1 Tax=Ferrimonas sp. YFM TaxID=3028878 RepID=UPI0025727F92|nr:hypothetical protein [Ferrimonas sp. YFM]
MTLLTISLTQPTLGQPAHRMPADMVVNCELATHHADLSLCQQCQTGCVWVAAATLLPVEIPQPPVPGSVPLPFEMPANYPTPYPEPLRPPIS